MQWVCLFSGPGRPFQFGAGKQSDYLQHSGGGRTHSQRTKHENWLLSAARSREQSISSTPLPGSAAGHGPPIFRSVVASKKAPASLIKIMKAKMSVTRKGGKPEFQCTGQMYVELTDSTANIGQVCEYVRGQWGSDYTVVSTEGVEIEDSLATQC